MFNKIYYEANTGADGGGATTPQPTTEPVARSFTQDEVNALMAKEKAKFEKVTQSKLAEIEEAQKLASMSEAERDKAEKAKLKEELNQYKNEKLATQFKLELSSKTLPPDFADFIPVQDAEKAKAAVDFLAKYKTDIASVLQKEIDDLKQQLTNANLRGVTPKAVSGAAATKTSIPTIF